VRSKPADSENDKAKKQTGESQRQALWMVLREEMRQSLLWLLQQSVSSFQSRQRAGEVQPWDPRHCSLHFPRSAS